jgi:hypothetical protein
MGWVLMVAGLVLVIVGLTAFGLIVCHRGLDRDRRRAQQAWDELAGELDRRHALIPPLARTVVVHLRAEQAALEDLLAQAEAAAAQSGLDAVARRAALEAEVGRGLERLRALALVRPGLGADADFQSLAARLRAANDHLAVAAESYNTVLDDYLDRLDGRGAKLVSRLTAFPVPAYFETAPSRARRGLEPPAGAPSSGLAADPAAGAPSPGLAADLAAAPPRPDRFHPASPAPLPAPGRPSRSSLPGLPAAVPGSTARFPGPPARFPGSPARFPGPSGAVTSPAAAGESADRFPGLGQASDTRPTFVPSFRLGDRRPPGPAAGDDLETRLLGRPARPPFGRPRPTYSDSPAPPPARFGRPPPPDPPARP